MLINTRKSGRMKICLQSPCYSYMRPGSKRASVTLHNLSEKSQMLQKGTVIACVQAANLIPPKLAPRETNTNNDNDNTLSKPTAERIQKLFSKLNLSSADRWEEDDLSELKRIFTKYHHIFALEDIELGKTDMVKHVIHLNDPISFRGRYRRIPPHQYDKFKKHLKEMLEIGAIRKSQSLWASAVILVRKKDGAL